MKSLGLSDPQKQLEKELDSWDIWSVEEKTRLDELHRMCHQWLDRSVCLRGVRFGHKVGQINPKWDKSGTFQT